MTWRRRGLARLGSEAGLECSPMYLYTYGHVTDKVSSAVSGKLFQGCPFLLAGVVDTAAD